MFKWSYLITIAILAIKLELANRKLEDLTNQKQTQLTDAMSAIKDMIKSGTLDLAAIPESVQKFLGDGTSSTNIKVEPTKG